MARKGQDGQAIETRARHSILAAGPATGSRLLVAVSGGADSVCLLYVLNGLGDFIADELGLTLHVAHLDHGLRGAESAADARYVARLARRLGIPASPSKKPPARSVTGSWRKRLGPFPQTGWRPATPVTTTPRRC